MTIRDGAVTEPDPAQVHTRDELATALRKLKGHRTYNMLKANGKEVGRTGLPGESTVSDLLKKGSCTQETLEGFLTMCQVPRDGHEAWLQAWQRSRKTRGPREAVRVQDATWKRLGVHDPIQVPGTDPHSLPVYVPRDVDDEPETGVRAQLAAAAASGGFVVLVGGSSTGKTRCLMEAVRAELGQWWLLRPTSARELEELAAAPPSRLVLWLDELRDFLEGEPVLSAATALRLIQGGCVLVGTLWPGYQNRYRALPDEAFGGGVVAGESADPHRQHRQVLKLAHFVRLPESPSSAETERARALAAADDGVGDPRLREALRQKAYGFIQAISAAPQLVEHWDNTDAYSRAVLLAAVDAVRFGVRAPLPAQLLKNSVVGYCDPAERSLAQPDWFENAMSYLTQRLHGAVRALTPVTVAASEMGQIDGYQVADYLRQHIGGQREEICPPSSFWDACVHHLTIGTDAERVAGHARRRLRYLPAIGLYQRAVELGAVAGRLRLAVLLARQDHTDTAVELLRQFLSESPDAEDIPYATVQLAALLDKQDRTGEAIGLLHELLRRIQDSDFYDYTEVAYVAEHLAGFLEAEGQIAAAVELLSGLAPWKDPAPYMPNAALAELLARHQMITELTERASTGDRFAAIELAAIEPPEGGLDAVIDTLQDLADEDIDALVRLAKVLEEEIGDSYEAIEILRPEAELDDGPASELMEEILFRVDDFETLRQRHRDNYAGAAGALAGLLASRGSLDQAMQILRQSADAGYGDADSIAEWIIRGLSNRRDEADDKKGQRLKAYGLTAAGEIASPDAEQH